MHLSTSLEDGCVQLCELEKKIRRTKKRRGGCRRMQAKVASLYLRMKNDRFLAHFFTLFGQVFELKHDAHIHCSSVAQTEFGCEAECLANSDAQCVYLIPAFNLVP